MVWKTTDKFHIPTAEPSSLRHYVTVRQATNSAMFSKAVDGALS